MNDLLYQAAQEWNTIINYAYVITFGYKNNLYDINIRFEPDQFPHLAGFQYLKDISLPRYNPKKIADKILDHTIQYDQVVKGINFSEWVLPRLKVISRLKTIMDNPFELYTFLPKYYPFSTRIMADYVITAEINEVSFVFIIKNTQQQEKDHEVFSCCSAFIQNNHDFRANQSRRKILKKQRIYLPDNTTEIIFDQLKK